MIALSLPVRRILEGGVFCHVAATTPRGPHVTPLVFALAGDRLWVTTSRGSVKAAAWRRDDRVAGVVRDGEESVTFAGRAAWHDALDPGTWMRSILEGPLLTLAAARFTRKNARFFAGYAVDADRVPFAWTPPGRVFVELRLDRWALLGREGGIHDAWGEWPDARPSAATFRRPTRTDPLVHLPRDIRAALGIGGDGVLAVSGSDGPAALPVRWTVDRSGLVAGAPEDVLALAGASTERPPVALAMDRASSWRARDMVGAMARGEGELASVDRLTSGATAARAVLRGAGADGEGAVAIGIRAERLVWWRGWQSGTVEVA